MVFEKLTRTEIVICEKVVEGKSNKEISQDLSISEKTVQNHMHNILYKLELKSRHQIFFLWEQIKNEYGIY